MKRFISCFVSIIFLLSLLFSVNFLVRFTRHEHLEEETCAICSELQSRNEQLHAPYGSFKSPSLCAPSLCCEETIKRRKAIERGRLFSPVSLKDKLLN